MQGRPKGGKNKYYSKEEKLKYVEQMLNGRSCWEIEREDGISHSITNRCKRNQEILYANIQIRKI